MKDKASDNKWSSLIVGAVLMGLGTYLVVNDYLGPGSFVTFTGLTFLLGLSLLGFPRLKKLDLKNLTIFLERAEAIQQDIVAKKDELTDASVALSKILMFNSAMMYRIPPDEAAGKRRLEWMKSQCEQLLSSLNVSDHQKKDVFKIAELISSRDEAQAKGDIRELKSLEEEIRRFVEKV